MLFALVSIVSYSQISWNAKVGMNTVSYTHLYKVGGNYAASLRANKKAHDLGYSCEFYLDAKERCVLETEVRVKAGILSPVLTISPLSFWANDSSENNAATQNKVTFFISYIF